MPVRLVAAALLALAWFGFTNAASPGEVIAAVAATLIAIAAYAGVRRQIDGESRLRWAWQAIRAWPVNIVGEAVRVFAAIARRRVPDGRFLTVRIDEATDADIAWTILGTSIAPNVYVVGWDREEHALLLHELIESDEPVWRPR